MISMHILQSTVYVKSSSQRDAKKMFEGEYASLEAMEKTGEIRKTFTS